VAFAYIALVVVYIFVCFFLILVVLLQQGKGADIAGAFGGGGSQTAFGARGATTLLHKLTTGAFVGFIVLALLLTVLEARPRSSVITTLPQKAATQKAPAPPLPAGTGAAPAPQPATGTPAQPATGAPSRPAPPPANPSGGPAKP
jgi:preprotein translocase subunit SecG